MKRTIEKHYCYQQGYNLRFINSLNESIIAKFRMPITQGRGRQS